MQIDIQPLFDSLSQWPLAQSNFSGLQSATTRELATSPMTTLVMHNPARVNSTMAKVDKAEIAKRKCFLCASNRPSEQMSIDWREYEILVNPYPIFQHHLTIVSKSHTAQAYSGRMADLYALALAIPTHTVFFNGAKCGASAPDHAHFQAGDGLLASSPLESKCLSDVRREIFRSADGVIEASEGSGRLAYCLWPTSEASAERLMKDLSAIRAIDNEMLNILAHVTERGVLMIVVPRRAFRPWQYTSQDEQQKMLISPAAVEVSGILITPRAEDYDKISTETAQDIVNQVCYAHDEEMFPSHKTNSEPTIAVGILCAEHIDVTLNGRFVSNNEKTYSSAHLTAECHNGELWVDGQPYTEFSLSPTSDWGTFALADVQIGIGFHWDQRETQTFDGTLKFVVDGEKIWAVNIVKVETYLRSVIASEMSATSDLELLKAHAVTSRSWLMAQVWGKGQFLGAQIAPDQATERIVWRDREDHTLFDVCADDHCQRYQGIGRVRNETVDKAIDATRGLLLTYEGRVCDARFSKCCGGRTEIFETCWGDTAHPYLQTVADNHTQPQGHATDLQAEPDATKWITETPDAFCNTQDTATLRQVLNSYDQTTADFYRWTVSYKASELGDIVRRKSGRDIGDIVHLHPLHRGPSGRLDRLHIVGTKGEMIVGKELEIRRLLSETHLYSSAFVVMEEDNGQRFTLRGAGWGHGVGLCQIGAAVMATKGFSFRSILYHYFRRARIEKMW